MDILELADRLWRGESSITDHHPVGYTAGLAEVAEGVAFIPAFGSICAFTTEDGLFMVDTGSSYTAPFGHAELRRWTDLPLHTAVFSHGHVDHVFGVGLFEEEARANGWPTPRVIAHENVPVRFDRYRLTAGYNQAINRRQFNIDSLIWPTEYRYPDDTYSCDHRLDVGGLGVDLHHAKGETDDATVSWIAERRVLCTGDLFIFATPNCGNPQKVQRYPREWSQALRWMDTLGAEYLLPGHGMPVVGADRVHQALTETAEYLESLVDQTLALMNAGARLADVLATVRAPAHLADRPFLQPVYDEPEFIVRNLWRLYGGWWDGNPATLLPAPEVRLAEEIAQLAGGAGALAERAEELAATGSDERLRLAGHLAELAWRAAPADPAVARVRQRIFTARAEAATSTMARGIFAAAARDSVPDEDSRDADR